MLRPTHHVQSFRFCASPSLAFFQFFHFFTSHYHMGIYQTREPLPVPIKDVPKLQLNSSLSYMSLSTRKRCQS